MKLVKLIKGHQMFHTINSKKQAHMEHQGIVLLQYLGNSGSGGSNPHLRSIFRIGWGTGDKFKYHCIDATHSL